MENFTSVCNDNASDTYMTFSVINGTSAEVYVSECLDVKACMPVTLCRERIQEHISPDTVEWIIIVVYAIVFIVGLVGNGLVCFIVLRSHYMRSVTNIFIVNLALADFMVLLICLPPSLLADITESWYLGETMCRVVPFLQTLSVAVSVLTLGAISIERYFAICHPLRMRLTSVTVTVFIIGIWISGILIALPELLYQKLRKTYPEHVTIYLQYCQPVLPPEKQKYYQIFLMIGLYDFPMCLMFFAYVTISVTLWKDTFPGITESRGSGRRRTFTSSRPESQLHARRKAAKMLMTIVILFALCYLPIHVFNILRYNGTLRELSPLGVVAYALVARGLCYFNSAMNPLIYNFMSAKFRQEFRAVIGLCRRPFRPDSKMPITLYNYRSQRSGNLNRSERYSMNTLSSRHGWLANTNSSKKYPY